MKQRKMTQRKSGLKQTYKATVSPAHDKQTSFRQLKRTFEPAHYIWALIVYEQRGFSCLHMYLHAIGKLTKVHNLG